MASGDGEQRESDMLILTRRVGESLMIGDEVTVTVLGVKGNQVRVGVNAPKEVAVHREEIYERIRRERSGESAAGPRAPQGLAEQQQRQRTSETPVAETVDEA